MEFRLTPTETTHHPLRVEAFSYEDFLRKIPDWRFEIECLDARYSSIKFDYDEDDEDYEDIDGFFQAIKKMEELEAVSGIEGYLLVLAFEYGAYRPWQILDFLSRKAHKSQLRCWDELSEEQRRRMDCGDIVAFRSGDIVAFIE